MPTLAAARESNATYAPTYTPVAVFVGGTSGIGQAMAKSLTSYLDGNIHLYIVGRNRSAALKTFASLPSGPPGTIREFLPCDAYLMRNIHTTCADLAARVPGGKIHFLVLSAGCMRATAREDTEEGLERMLVMRYYNRFKFATELLPLLVNARDAGEDTRMMTVLGTGLFDVAVDREDFDLHKSWGFWNVATKPGAYNDIMVEALATRTPGIGFTHIYPGTVRTAALEELFASWWVMRLLSPLYLLRQYLTAVSAEECAEYMLYALLDGKDGWYRRDNHGEDIGSLKYNIPESDKEALWQHSVKVTANN